MIENDDWNDDGFCYEVDFMFGTSAFVLLIVLFSHIPKLIVGDKWLVYITL